MKTPDLRDLLTADSMKATLEIPMTYGPTVGLESINPYHIMDGQWGGFGPATWFTFEQFGHNVLEWSMRDRCWKRVWDDEKQLWREPTAEEASTPAAYNPPPACGNFDKIIFPVIKSMATIAE